MLLFGSIKHLLRQSRQVVNVIKAQSNKTIQQTSHFRYISNGSQQTDPYDPRLVEFNPDREFEAMSIDKFASLATDERKKQLIEKILYEYEYEKYTTLIVPKTLTVEHMKELLLANDKSERLKFFSYLFCRERDKYQTKVAKKRRSADKQIELRAKYSTRDASRSGIFDNNFDLVYGLWHNTLFTRIDRPNISKSRNIKLLSSVIWGQKLVIDLSYDKYMTRQECNLLSKQIHESYYFNKYRTVEPFDLIFTNTDMSESGITFETIMRNNTEAKINDSFIRSRFFTQSYLDLFPHSDLVYLSPHSKQAMTHFDPTAVYIIGGMVDKTCREPLSYGKAITERIKCYKLPLEDYLVWGSGGKSLCVNHVVQILHGFKHTDNWQKTLQDCVPKRKQKTEDEIRFEDDYRMQKLKRQHRIQRMQQKIDNFKHGLIKF